MELNEIKNIVDSVICEIVEDSKQKMPFDGKNMFEDLEFDSVSILELMTSLEERFKIEFEPRKIIDALNSYDELVKAVFGTLQ